jgi:transposase InsO family protein
LDKQKRFEIIADLVTSCSIAQLCEIAEVSRSGYYKWQVGKENRMNAQDQDATLKEHILAIHRLRPYFGYIRMRTALKREGIVVNHKKVRRLMRELGIRSVIRRKRPFAGRKPSVLFANVLARKFTAEKPGEKLVTDITYIRVDDDFMYLSVVLDLFNNEVAAWEFSARNDLELVRKTVEKLHETGAILHSDQGFQYTSNPYAAQLKKQELIGSHSRRGNCFDNACVESFFSHLKAEKIYLEKPKDSESARRMIAEYIEFYNTERFQKKLGDRSPVEFREAIAA